MYTITAADIVEHREPSLETDDYAEGEFLALVQGVRLRVTYYANRDHVCGDWDIDYDDTGDSLASSRVRTSDLMAVDADLILTLSADLRDMFADAE